MSIILPTNEVKMNMGLNNPKTDNQATTHFTGIQQLHPGPNASEKKTESEMCSISYQNTKLKHDNQKR